jgi:DNA modification methylase
LESISENSRVQQLDREGTLLSQLATLTSATAYETRYATHGLHPYPAKYIPQLPNLIIREHTNERNTVFDPFCGSGTTLLEAAMLGRKSIGVDSNPVAALISRAKTTALRESQFQELTQLADWSPNSVKNRVRRIIPRGPGIDLEHWFSAEAIKVLGAIRFRIDQIQDQRVRDTAACAFSRVVVWASNQESETRYAAVEKDRDPDQIADFFQRKLTSTVEQVRGISQLDRLVRNRPNVICSDVRSAATLLGPEPTSDLVVTSPPYPNSFDYYLYHKWRMVWLGFDVGNVMRAEIGSRREHSSGKQPIDAYILKMRDAINSIAGVLKPAKLAYFFVGDAVIGGKFIDIAEAFERIVDGTPLRFVADTKYSLAKVSRSFREKTSKGCHGGKKTDAKMQHVLVFERTNGPQRPLGRSQARPTVHGAQGTVLSGPVSNGSTLLIDSQAARHIHSLGRYPSKFIPEVPAWAISEFSREGDLVLDPFGGSGTTAVEAALSGRPSLSVDYSQYACLLTRAKASWLESKELLRSTRELANKLGRSRRKSTLESDLPLADFWFPADSLNDLLVIREEIDEISKGPIKDFLHAILSTCVRPCSYQDSGQIKVKRDPKKVLTGVPDAKQLFLANLAKFSAKKLEFLERVPARPIARVVNASADDPKSYLAGISPLPLVVTSPPYINAMNYPMTHRLESFVLGLMRAETKTSHEAGYIGTERVWAADYNRLHAFEKDFDGASELNEMLSTIFSREPKRSFIAYEYFRRMRLFFERIAPFVAPGGKLVLVAGRNTIKDVQIDTVTVLAAIAEQFGFSTALRFDYEIVKNALKLTRHQTSRMIAKDGVFVLERN